MMPHWLIELLKYSILIAACIAIFRFQKTDNRYHPFFYLIWLGVINEVISTILIHNGYYNIINSTIYTFIEVCMIFWLFYNFGLFKPLVLAGILIIVVAAFVIEELYIRFQAFNSYSRIVKNFIIVLCSISMINKLLVEEKDLIVKHPMFILSVCFIVYFLMGIVIEAFFVYHLPFTTTFKKNILIIMSITNLIINFIYVAVFILMPGKKYNNFKQVHSI